MKYLIKKAEAVTSAKGTTYKRATLEAEGVTIDVSVWSDYSQYDKVENGNEVEGVIVENGKYKNLKDGNLGSKPPSFAQKSRITNAIKEKSESIAKAQSFNRDSYKLSGTMRDAVAITVAESQFALRDGKDYDFDAGYDRWHKKLWDTYDYDVTQYPPF